MPVAVKFYTGSRYVAKVMQSSLDYLMEAFPDLQEQEL